LRNLFCAPASASHPSTISRTAQVLPTHMFGSSKAAPAPDEGPVREFLARHEFPPGLAETMLQTKGAFAHRYWVVDNSGSMCLLDGQRFEAHKGKERMVACSRYEEAKDLLLFHAELAALLHAPTTFTFLNHPNASHSGPHSFTVDSPATLEPLLAAAAAHPKESDPICARVREVTAMIAKDEQALRDAGKQVVVVIATDGMPSDGDLWEAVEPLTKMPVKIVVRLCCEEARVIKFWNELDSQHDIDLDVLDDLHAEALEVKRLNPWFTYSTQIHRLREWGVHLKVRVRQMRGKTRASRERAGKRETGLDSGVLLLECGA